MVRPAALLDDGTILTEGVWECHAGILANGIPEGREVKAWGWERAGKFETIHYEGMTDRLIGIMSRSNVRLELPAKEAEHRSV